MLPSPWTLLFPFAFKMEILGMLTEGRTSLTTAISPHKEETSFNVSLEYDKDNSVKMMRFKAFIYILIICRVILCLSLYHEASKNTCMQCRFKTNAECVVNCGKSVSYCQCTADYKTSLTVVEINA